jgi:hypothetical protein
MLLTFVLWMLDFIPRFMFICRNIEDFFAQEIVAQSEHVPRLKYFDVPRTHIFSLPTGC